MEEMRLVTEERDSASPSYHWADKSSASVMRRGLRDRPQRITRRARGVKVVKELSSSPSRNLGVCDVEEGTRKSAFRPVPVAVRDLHKAHHVSMTTKL